MRVSVVCVCVVCFLSVIESAMEEIDHSLFLINLKSSLPEGPRPQLDMGSAIARRVMKQTFPQCFLTRPALCRAFLERNCGFLFCILPPVFCFITDPRAQSTLYALRLMFIRMLQGFGVFFFVVVAKSASK